MLYGEGEESPSLPAGDVVIVLKEKPLAAEPQAHASRWQRVNKDGMMLVYDLRVFVCEYMRACDTFTFVL